MKQLLPLPLVFAFILVGSFSDLLHFSLTGLVRLTGLPQQLDLSLNRLEVLFSLSSLILNLSLQYLFHGTCSIHFLLLGSALSVDDRVLLFHLG